MVAKASLVKLPSDKTLIIDDKSNMFQVIA